MSPREPATVIVATTNPGKLREIERLLADPAWRLRSLTDCGPVSLPEEGDDYEANALAKARAVAAATGYAAVADDSGLEVDALDGAPGPFSARYGAPDLDDAGRVAHLLDVLCDVPPERRGARFVGVVAWVAPDGSALTAWGECAGVIVAAPRGAGGFGYDPVFQPTGEPHTMAELCPDRKNALSHRARAFRALAAKLRHALRPRDEGS